MVRRFNNMFLGSALSVGLIFAAVTAWAQQMPAHFGGPSVNMNKYSDNLLATFGAVPIVDTESASLFNSEKSFYQLKENNSFSDIQNQISDKELLKGEYTFVDDAGKQVVVNKGANDYYHPYSRLEELRQVALSYKPEPAALNAMRHDTLNKGEGTSLYPGNKDDIRAFDGYINRTSENVATYYKGAAVNPGIKQILFYNRDGYQTLQAMPIRTIDLQMMEDLAKQREESATFDEREPLKIAAWFEHKLLMPAKDVTVTINGRERLLTGGEEMAKSMMSKRRRSFLQESILDALRTSAYVQIKSTELIDVIGLPASDGAQPPQENLMNSLIGEGVTFSKKEKEYYTFDGPFLSAVTPTGNSSVDTDLNSSLRVNFIARDIFMQMLANYQQVLAARLRLRVAASLMKDPPKLSDDEAGVGAVQKIYNEEMQKRKDMQKISG